ncbi:MAG: hypothetical protein PHH16_04160 [Candidatus Gracilibacteria bacterium]|nr:hypothetical protein [Candidatus Gracilibacteria bacterium]
MGFFDSVLEEAPKAGVAGSPTVKKDEQDGSFLIVDDSINASTLPDTAVQLFDVAPTETADTQETVSSEISFFSEPTVVSPTETEETKASSSPEIAFFDGPVMETVAPAEPNSGTDDIVSFMEEPAATATSRETSPELAEVQEPIQENVKEEENSLFGTVSVEAIQEEPVVSIAPLPEKNDIYAPLKKAIAEYDTILMAHTRIAEAKDSEIAEYNNQVAVAKAAAKKALEERKALETEMDRVKQMKELFSAQLK